MERDEILDALIARRLPAVELADTAATALVIFAFPVLAGGIIAVYFGYFTTRSVGVAYFGMTLAGAGVKIAAAFVRKQVYLRRAALIGFQRKEASAYWDRRDRDLGEA